MLAKKKKKFDKYIFYPLSWQGVGTRVTNSRDRSVHSAILGLARSVNRAVIRILKLDVWRSGWHMSLGWLDETSGFCLDEAKAFLKFRQKGAAGGTVPIQIEYAVDLKFANCL